jgi:hypothetical protein
MAYSKGRVALAMHHGELTVVLSMYLYDSMGNKF